MRIYIAGIFGTAMKPLALMARAVGFEVYGSDMDSVVLKDEDLITAGVNLSDRQDGSFLAECMRKSEVDWYVYSSAIQNGHIELEKARELGLKTTKRDDFIAFLMEKLNLKMVAVAGTHGKTTTTAMIIWALQKLGISASYLVGTELPFGKAGYYAPESDYFIYEADEYDRNFLRFSPWLSVITNISYDHADIYKTKEEYLEAFLQFMEQSEKIIAGAELKNKENTLKKTILSPLEGKIELSGKIRRYDASLAGRAVLEVVRDITGANNGEKDDILQILGDYPGARRRFERISEGFYTDYAHHPEEIAATLEMAQEESEKMGFCGVVAVYEPHQNTRQHEIIHKYREAFLQADKIFWLPTFLTRENPELPILKPADFIKTLDENQEVHAAEMNEELMEKLKDLRSLGYLVLLMTAGPADRVFRKAVISN